jgi:hypothetical protein
MKINVCAIKNIIECAVTCVSLLKLNLSFLKVNQRESYSMHAFPNLFDSRYTAEEYRLKQKLFLNNTTSSYSYIIHLSEKFLISLTSLCFVSV